MCFNPHPPWLLSVSCSRLPDSPQRSRTKTRRGFAEDREEKRLTVTLERICKAVLLLCLVHFLIMMILYFDVYSQRFDIFSRFNNGRNSSSSRTHPFYNLSRPNATFAGYLGTMNHIPSAHPEANVTSTAKPVPPCPEVPSGLGSITNELLWIQAYDFASMPHMEHRRSVTQGIYREESTVLRHFLFIEEKETRA
ncbi:beta-1,4-galactosyltransferase 2 [Arapaima gigas]